MVWAGMAWHVSLHLLVSLWCGGTLYHHSHIGPIAPWKGLDPFRLRHAGSGIKLASEITPCLSCTVAPEPELLGWWTFGSFLALCFASELGLLPAPDSLALPRLLGCWPPERFLAVEHWWWHWASGTILKPKVCGVSVAGGPWFSLCVQEGRLFALLPAYFFAVWGWEMEEERGTSAWHKVPTWDGAPTSWRRFKREMSWWVSSLDLESTRKYNLAARWLLRQSGVVRQRGEEFTPQELQYRPAEIVEDPDTGEELTVVEEDLLAGLNKLLDALESINGKTDLDRKGELRSLFYLELSRKPGERISEFCTRFRTLSADLRNEGILLPSSELGWFLREKVGLDSIRKQLLETALNGRDSYEAVEGETLRLFKDIHTADPLQKRFGGGSDGKPSLMSQFLSSSQTSGTRSSNSSGGGRSFPASSTRSFRSSTGSTSSYRSDFRPKPLNSNPARQSLVTEMDPPEEENDEGEELVPDGDGDAQGLEEVLQAEAALLASDLEALEADGCEPELLEELEAGVEGAAEALISMREARAKINDVKKDRGYGRAGNGPQAGGGNRLPKPHGNQVNSRKKTTRCFDCDLPGHWAGDRECKKPGAGLGPRTRSSKVMVPNKFS